MPFRHRSRTRPTIPGEINRRGMLFAKSSGGNPVPPCVNHSCRTPLWRPEPDRDILATLHAEKHGDMQNIHGRCCFHQVLVSRLIGGAAAIALQVARYLRDNGYDSRVWLP